MASNHNDLVPSATARHSWESAGSIREGGGSAFESRRQEDEEELKWAAIERLPTYNRVKMTMIPAEAEGDGGGRAALQEVDVTRLRPPEKKLILERILKFVEDDNEQFLRRLRQRADRVGIESPEIEIRFENLTVEGNVYVGSRALPTLFNATLDAIESFLGLFRIIPSRKKKIQILKDVSGIIKPSRITLLLGPPSAGKTTLMLALAAKLDRDLKESGRITYCGHEFNEFVPQRTCAYISQHDLHFGEMTVRETLDFSGRCLGVGTRFEMLAELSRREKAAGIKPDPEIDAFMKAIAVSGQKNSLITDYVLKILGLDICPDIMVGDAMRRGISGGQKKRVTTGEMLVGPAKTFFMDEISTGLDSSTTFQICKYMKQMVHILDVTMVISLLQPAPETFELFDDIILLSEGEIVYQGPREHIMEFFEFMGFKCPERKGIADFLQEVTSLKDQEQYWYRRDQPYRYISVSEFRNGFESFHIGQKLSSDLKVPYDKSKTHPAALVSKRYGVPNKDIFKACLSREWLLMKRNSFFYVFKTIQITITALIAMSVFFRTEMQPGTLSGGFKFYGVMFFGLSTVMFNGIAEMSYTINRLPVFYKQRDFLFYPSWSFALPMSVLRIPLSVLEAGIWVIITYYTIGFAPAASRFFKQFLAFFWLNQMALGLFRCVGGVGRTQVVSNTITTLVLLVTYVLGGFMLNRNDIPPWLIWGYYISPVMYAQTAIVTNEFLDERWSKPSHDPSINATTVGEILLKSRGFVTDRNWFWICIGALIGFTILFNVLFILALTYLNPFSKTKAIVIAEDEHTNKKKSGRQHETKDTAGRDTSGDGPKRGMILPFQPLSLSFDHVIYYVDLPAEMKSQGVEGDRLQLLKDISGTFRPGILTALMGVSGAGKTTLMDVLAGRKTGGHIEGNISLAGYPKKQSTFARISGYCEQNDIHSPTLTVYESLLFSAWLRLSPDVDSKTREMFVQQVMELVELKPLRDSLVGLPGVDGLSTEQRKRLTIAVELVANPSIIFMDEPTSGLDARAAAIVMRTVRNTVDTGRTVVCTIHQPSIDIFEAFDELLLMKRGGQMIYAGPIGHNSQKLIQYFEAVPNVQKIWDGYNPATWMLEVTTTAVETRLGVDFAEIYANSLLYQRNQELVKETSIPAEGSTDLHFPTEYSQPFLAQCKACFWKVFWSYWRNPEYNAMRFVMTFIYGALLGLIFWQKGTKTARLQDLTNFFGAMYGAALFMGNNNIVAVLPIVDTERTVFYREKAAGMYSPIPYAFSQVAVEIIYNILQAMLYCILLYALIGLEWTPAKFFWFLFFITSSVIYFTLCGMMFVSITPTRDIALLCTSFATGLWNLFSGFLIPRTQLAIWWRWYSWVSPLAWTLYGLVTSQVGDKDSMLEVPGVGKVHMKEYLRENFGFEHNFLPVVAAVHVGFVLVFLLCFAYGIKFFNFQKR